MIQQPTNRLDTTDREGKRVYLYPAAVRGFFHRRRQWVHAFLLMLFLALPWLQVGGKQLVLLDLVHREFSLFGLHFRSHDAPLILFLFLAFVFLMATVTALWGRVWCGWACPQTVFTEFLFRRVEEWVEGPPRARRELDAAPWDFNKFRRRSTKWAIYALLSLLFTHSFLAYFVGSRTLIDMVTAPPAENWGSFLVILATTAIVLLDFGWFREQFCVIVCPYGRFQSLLLDSRSLVVGYDPRRGEPRRGSAEPGKPAGDCVDCFRCVQVCPTGIDIRRGLQMECIGCTACIDACDEVMSKTKKPPGLIRYTTLAELAGKTRIGLHLRPLIYGFFLVACLGGLAAALYHKDFLDVTALRAPGNPYELQQGSDLVLNHFRVDLSNQTGQPVQLQFSLDEASRSAGAELIFPVNPYPLPDSAKARAEFFVRFPKQAAPGGHRKFQLLVEYAGGRKEMELSLVGPNL